MLLLTLPEPADPQQQELHRNIQTLVERAAMQQAKSSASCLRYVASYPVEGQARNSQTPQSTNSKGIHPTRVTTPRHGSAAPQPGALLAAPPGAWLARAHLRRTQRHPLTSTGPLRH
jgi:hypothetical protein